MQNVYRQEEEEPEEAAEAAEAGEDDANTIGDCELRSLLIHVSKLALLLWQVGPIANVKLHFFCTGGILHRLFQHSGNHITLIQSQFPFNQPSLDKYVLFSRSVFTLAFTMLALQYN